MENMLLDGNWYRTVGTFTEVVLARPLGLRLASSFRIASNTLLCRAVILGERVVGTAQLFHVTHSDSQLLMTRSAPKKRDL